MLRRLIFWNSFCPVIATLNAETHRERFENRAALSNRVRCCLGLKHVERERNSDSYTNSLNQMIAEENLSSIIHRMKTIQFKDQG